MKENFEEILSNNFFIIDSNNFTSVNNQFYGYSIYDDKLITSNENQVKLNGNGAYINIEVRDDVILIQQDFMGSYGLYYYLNNDYFAISNSFLKLVEFLKINFKLSFNEDYANSFLFADLCSFVYEETLVNEIKLIPRDYDVIINKKDNSLNFKKIQYYSHTVDLDSNEGIELLDNWYKKWVGIIRSLKKDTNNISFDLTGGFDTRVLAALWLSANIDLDKVNIYTVEDCKKKFQKEDYEIATEIANKFNFKLNCNVMDIKEIMFENPIEPIVLSFYTKLGFHKEMYFRYHKSDKFWFSISGYAGESIRGYPNTSWNHYVNNILSRAGHNIDFLQYSSNKLLKSGKDLFLNRYDIVEDDELPEYFYNDVRVRHHYGKSLVEHFFANEVILTPLADPELLKLKMNSETLDDKHLLITLIYLRYCPELLNFKFEGNRFIPDKTIEYAKKINKKYPFDSTNYTFISGPEIKSITNNQLESKNNDKSGFSVDLLKKIFYSKDFENKFSKVFPIEFYYEIIDFIEKEKFHPLKHAYAALSVLKIYDDINLHHKNLEDWLDSFDISNYNVFSPVIISKLLKFNKARIDIKNEGNSENSIQVINYDDDCLNYSYPNWFKNKKGKGLLISSLKSHLKLKIKCINDGKLKIYLKGIDFKDKNNNRIPIYINYTSVLINGKEQITNDLLVCHDSSHLIELNVNDSDIIDLEIKWDSINHSVLFKNREKELLEKNKKLKNENKLLNEQNLELKSSNSNYWRSGIYNKIKNLFSFD